MKNKLLLFLFTAIPFAMHSQAVFYNKGAMCVVAQDTTKTSLYINGDFVAATDATDNTITSKILVKNSRVVLTGDFKNNVTAGTVFIRPAVADEGLFEFRADKPQAITTDGTTYATIPSKRTSFIEFPNLQINNSKHVTMASELAAKTKDIKLTKGWLILDSKRVETKDYEGSLTSDLQENRTVLAHLYVDGAVDYQNWTAADPNERGFIEVNLKMDPEKTRTLTETKSLVGFGIPFQGLRADYFMWNFLVSPTNLNYWGNSKKEPILDPKTKLVPGKGYATTIDIRGSEEAPYLGEVMDEYESIAKFSQRAKDGHYFNRFKFASDVNRKANQVHGTDLTSEAYALEKLNVNDVNVALEKGYNYLANPFMAPLSVDELLGEGISAANWGVVADGSSNTSRDLVNRVWILKGDAAASSIAEGTRTAKLVYNYYLAKNVGGTYTNEYEDGDGGVTIAPLQMFLVNAVKAGTITIPKNQRTMSGAKFIRSTPKNKRQDDFIIEVIDENTRMSDRTSFVLRSEEELATNKNYLNIKRLSTASTSDAKSAMVVNEGPVEQNIFNQIYTVDNSGNALTLKFLPLETTNSVDLYMTPAVEAQDITIRGLRLNTKSRVQNIWLEDKLENRTVELTPQTLYQTKSLPDDRADRFVLHFRYGSGIDDQVKDGDRVITAYYADNALTVKGFNTADLGNKIFLYNMQGNLVKQANVDDLTVTIPCSLIPGAYIVKTTCEKSNVTKLLVK